MPYIPTKQRLRLLNSFTNPETPGELNYMLTALCEGYRGDKGDSYQTHNDIMGVLDCAAREYYRRVVVPFEDAKCIENGEVYAEPNTQPRLLDDGR